MYELLQTTGIKAKRWSIWHNGNEIVRSLSKKAATQLLNHLQESNNVQQQLPDELNQSGGPEQSRATEAPESNRPSDGVRQHVTDRQDDIFFEKYRCNREEQRRNREEQAIRYSELFGQLEQFRRFEIATRQAALSSQRNERRELEQETIEVEHYETTN